MNCEELVSSQRRFFNTHKTVDIEFRRQKLKILKDAIINNMDELTSAIEKDLKRGQKYSKILEIMGALAEIDYMRDNIQEWSKAEHKERTLPYILNGVYTVRQPLGVVLIIAPWNYPLGLVLLPLIPAIAAGNCVVIKPSEHAPATSKAIKNFIAKTFDKDYIAVVEGGIAETTHILQQKFDHIFYTGSQKVGKIIMSAAAKNLTPVTLELGGKSPAIICSDTNIDLAAKRVAWGKWMNCGQTCIAPDYVMVQHQVKVKFVEAVKKYLIEFYDEDAQKHPDYPRIINQGQFDRIKSLVDASDGTILHQGGEFDRDDLYIPPVIVEVKHNDELMKDEIFGPIMPILCVDNVSEAIEVVQSGDRPLAIYLFTNNTVDEERVRKETTSGQLAVNDVVIQFVVDTLPFGGVGSSGMGRYTGKYGFETFSHEKAVLTAGFMGEFMFSSRYPPVTDAKIRQLQFLTGTRIRIPETEILLGLKVLAITIIGVLLGMYIQERWRF